MGSCSMLMPSHECSQCHDPGTSRYSSGYHKMLLTKPTKPLRFTHADTLRRAAASHHALREGRCRGSRCRCHQAFLCCLHAAQVRMAALGAFTPDAFLSGYLGHPAVSKHVQWHLFTHMITHPG